jgi:short-subunit dehydrogenase
LRARIRKRPKFDFTEGKIGMKIAVITGASSGMGKEFVLQLSREKQLDEIWVIARRRERLEALQNEVSVKIRPVALDLTLDESIEEYRKLLEAE